jgi:hypothetical protein
MGFRVDVGEAARFLRVGEGDGITESWEGKIGWLCESLGKKRAVVGVDKRRRVRKTTCVNIWSRGCERSFSRRRQPARLSK